MIPLVFNVATTRSTCLGSEQVLPQEFGVSQTLPPFLQSDATRHQNKFTLCHHSTTPLNCNYKVGKDQQNAATKRKIHFLSAGKVQLCEKEIDFSVQTSKSDVRGHLQHTLNNMTKQMYESRYLEIRAPL